MRDCVHTEGFMTRRNGIHNDGLYNLSTLLDGAQFLVLGTCFPHIQNWSVSYLTQHFNWICWFNVYLRGKNLEWRTCNDERRLFQFYHITDMATRKKNADIVSENVTPLRTKLVKVFYPMLPGFRKTTAFLEDPRGDWWIILKWIFEKWDGGMEWIDLAHDREQVADCSECGNEPSGSIKPGEFD